MSRTLMSRRLFRSLAGVFALALMAFAPCVQASPIYLNFGSATDPAGATWNHIATATFGSNVADLNDSAGDPTGISATVSNDFSGVFAGGGDWGGTPVPWALNDATNPSFFVDPNQSGAITFAGLDTGKTYTISLISSRAATGNRYADYALNGVAPDDFPGFTFHSYTDGWLARDLLVWADVAPNGSGELVLSVTTDPSGYGYVNALSIEEVVPEPASLMLLASGLLLMVHRGHRGHRGRSRA